MSLSVAVTDVRGSAADVGDVVFETVVALALAFVVAHVLVVVILTGPLWLALRRYL